MFLRQPCCATRVVCERGRSTHLIANPLLGRQRLQFLSNHHELAETRQLRTRVLSQIECLACERTHMKHKVHVLC